MVFEFDPDKSEANKAKHGIDFIEAQALWLDDKRVEIDARFAEEVRTRVIGAIADRVWTAIVTRRGPSVRIISVRRARDNEVKRYESEQD